MRETKGMDQARAREIVDRWVMPTEEGTYMGGIENRPILASANGSIVVDIDGKEYLDFQSGQMGAAIGHRHPRVMASIRKSTETFVHASNIMLNVPRLELSALGDEAQLYGALYTASDLADARLFAMAGSLGQPAEAGDDLARPVQPVR